MWTAGGSAFLLGLLLLALVWWQTRPPADFPLGTAVNVSRGLSAGAVADVLHDAKVVRSSDLLYLTLILYHDPSSVQAGLYVFDRPLSVFEVADRITSAGIGGDRLVAVTLPEGFTAREFAAIAAIDLPEFDAASFLAGSREGYLFPDTYFVPVDFTAEELLNLLSDTYEQKTAGIKERMAAHPLGEAGVLTLASLVEREANTEDSMKMVSGILQNRLEIGMALQADASIEYVLDRPLHQLEPEDLELDTPYNTYLYPGLPPTPIGNPGLASIMAVLEPEPSDFLYYITDEEGDFHYAETFDEHRANIAKYLQ